VLDEHVAIQTSGGSIGVESPVRMSYLVFGYRLFIELGFRWYIIDHDARGDAAIGGKEG
jgi:hypothetical protein